MPRNTEANLRLDSIKANLRQKCTADLMVRFPDPEPDTLTVIERVARMVTELHLMGELIRAKGASERLARLHRSMTDDVAEMMLELGLPADGSRAERILARSFSLDEALLINFPAGTA